MSGRVGVREGGSEELMCGVCVCASVQFCALRNTSQREIKMTNKFINKERKKSINLWTFLSPPVIIFTATPNLWASSMVCFVSGRGGSKNVNIPNISHTPEVEKEVERWLKTKFHDFYKTTL